MKPNFKHITGGLVALTFAMAPLTLQANDWLKPHATIGNQQPILVQSNSAQVTVEVDQLREQVRSLNGRVEELTFQLLQLQEQVRKMQEDNEFRFQELEEKDSHLQTDEDKNKDLAENNADQENTLGKLQPSEREETRLDGKTNTTADVNPEGAQEEKKSSNPIANFFNALKFDEDGNLIIGSLKKPLEHEKRGDLGDYSDRLDKILQQEDPLILYKFGRDQIKFGDYILAAETFNVFLQKYTDHELRSDALYWLGNSYLLQDEYEKSAEVFLQHYREHPESPLAPETLLNIGINMAGLNQRELACATFAEVPSQYPDISPDLKRKLKRQQKGANCS